MRPRLEEEDTVLLRRLSKSQKKNKTKQNRGFSSSLILLRALCILFLPFFFRGFVNSLPASQPDNGVCKPQVSLLVLFWLHQKSENRFAQIIYTQFCKLKDIF